VDKNTFAGVLGIALLLLLRSPSDGAPFTPYSHRSDQYSGRYGDLSDIYLNDNSDWWSEYFKANLGANPFGQSLSVRPRQGNFEILGISLWSYSVKWPQAVVHELGKATVIERGDAGVGRAQVCYQSAENSGQTKLIFEEGECLDSFYLFEDGHPFVGSDACVASQQVTCRLETLSGLGLGQTHAEVAKILGVPSKQGDDFLTYNYYLTMRRTKEQLEEDKSENPGYGTPDPEYENHLVINIEFRNGRSWYLHVRSGMCE
jgi:hypothetical protein